MVNPWLMLAGLGMILAGIIPIIWWSRKKRVPSVYFFFGILVWAIAIAPKAIMDFTITPPLSSYLRSHWFISVRFLSRDIHWSKDRAV